MEYQFPRLVIHTEMRCETSTPLLQLLKEMLLETPVPAGPEGEPRP